MNEHTKAHGASISRLRVPEEHEVHESVRPIMEQSRKQHGYVENWLISLALNPGTLSRCVSFFSSLFDPKEGSLSPAERELIAVVVSAENGCSYCEIHHTKGLARALGNPLRARRVALGHTHVPDLTARANPFV